LTAEPPPRLAARIALACVALLCAAPGALGIHLVPLTTFYEEWLAAAFGTAACAALLVGSRAQPIAVPATALPLIGFLGVLGLQLALGRTAYAQQVTLAMLYVLFAIAMLWCGLQLRAAAGAARAAAVVAAALVVGGALNAAAAVLQSYAPGSALGAFALPLASPRASGNLGQANLLADQLAVAGVSLVYLHARGTVRILPAAAIGLLLAAGMTLCGSRSVWIYAAWVLAWALYAHRATQAPHYRTAAWAVAAAVGALVALAFALPPSAAPAAQAAAPEATAVASGLGRLATTGIDAGSEGLRRYFLEQAWLMFRSAPALGVGVGGFPFAFLEQGARFAELGIPGQERNAHNLVAHLAAETGIAGAACVLAALVLWLWGALAAPLDRERWWIIGAVGVVLLHSLVEYPLWYAHFLGPFALLVGLGEARAFAPRNRRLAIATAAAVVVLGAAVLGSLWRGYGELRRWIYLVPEQALNDPAVVRRQAEAVERLHPTLLGPYVELALASTLRMDGANLAAKLELNGRVLRFAPIAPVVFRQIVLLAAAGRNAEATRLLDAAAVLHPNDLDAFAADVERLAAGGLDLAALARHLGEIRTKARGKS